MNSKIVSALHLIGGLIAQGAVIAIFPSEYVPYFQALAAVVQVLIAFFDPTNAIEKLGMTKESYLGKISK